MSKALMIAPVVIFTALTGLFAGGMFVDNGDELPSAMIGKPAPALEIDEIEGLPVLTQDVLTDGELKLVNFWASWCAPCRTEHPNLTELAEDLPLYGINYQDFDPNARAFLSELGDPFTAHGADRQGFHALDWGVYGVPETFLVAGDGTILLRMAGPVTQRGIEARLQPAIEAHLAE
ncbi:MAG: DsbE family thiol:disulfide interchange protein [Pseudomonadota bacterium]